jgi:hypothetical protein
MQEAKSRIERRLQQEQQKKAYDAYLGSLEKRYPVKIYDENITGTDQNQKNKNRPNQNLHSRN